MLVILDIDPKAPAHLLGIWAPPTADHPEPRPWYPEANAVAEASAAERIADHGANRSWSELADYLSSTTPYVAWWEATEADDTGELSALYDQLAKERFEWAARIDGTTIESADMTFTSKMLTPANKLWLAAKTPAQRIAVILGVPAGAPSHTTGRLSTLLRYFDDEQRLLVVAGDNQKPAAVNLALAHGLAQAGDRDLWIVVPDGLARPLLRRIPFLDRKVRIWTWDGTALEEQIIPAPAEVVAELSSDPLAADILDLGQRSTWVTPLLAWAEIAPSVTPNHNQSYLAWHCNGRRVLQISGAKGGQLRIIAGVQHAASPATTMLIEGPLDPANAHQLLAQAAAACAGSLDGTDPAAPEHRMQATLTPQQFGLLSWRREFPARRPVPSGGSPSLGGDGRGYIDFLGVDANRDLHIVETKVGSDDMLVLQGLDYWIWATAQKKALGAHFGVDIRNVIIDFVTAPAAPGGQAVGPYSAEQADALAGDVTWRFWTVDDPTDPVPTRHPARHVPCEAPRRCPAGFEPWAKSLQKHLGAIAAARGKHLVAGVFWPEAADGLTAEAADAAAGLIASGLDHKMLRHVRSSQAFALNLFATLDEPGRLAVLAELGIDAQHCPPPVFEWSDPSDRLHEATPACKHTTQVDVVLYPDGPESRHLVLIEVKLSETDFGHCSGYTSPRNPDRHACRQPHPFGGDHSGCFQLRNHDRGQPRRYLDFLGPFSEAPAGRGCWFRLGTNQVMRNVALARSLVETGDADTVTVAVCAPIAHRAIWRRWAEARSALSGVSGITLAPLAADAVAIHLPLLDGLELANRYLLDVDAVRTAASNRSWQLWADALFPKGAAYVVEPPSWDEPHTHYVGQVGAAADGEQVAVSILPVMNTQYNPTTWTLDPDQLQIEWSGKLCRLRTDPEHNCWLVSPSLAPPNPYITNEYLAEVLRHFVELPISWDGPLPGADLPDLGVGA